MQDSRYFCYDSARNLLNFMDTWGRFTTCEPEALGVTPDDPVLYDADVVTDGGKVLGFKLYDADQPGPSLGWITEVSAYSVVVKVHGISYVVPRTEALASLGTLTSGLDVDVWVVFERGSPQIKGYAL